MEKRIYELGNDKIGHKIHYYLYRDNDFMRQIYSQIFDSMPDIGIVEYIGSKSLLNNVEYKVGGEHENIGGEDLKCEEKKSSITDRQKNDIRTEIRHTSSQGINHTRIIANIEDVKQIMNTNMYNDIINYLIKNVGNLNPDLCLFSGKLCILDTYNDQSDVFTTVDDVYLWMKAKFLDTDIRILCNIADSVNILGYVIKEKDKTAPKIVKVIAIYI